MHDGAADGMMLPLASYRNSGTPLLQMPPTPPGSLPLGALASRACLHGQFRMLT